MREIRINVGRNAGRQQKVWGYPNGAKDQLFWVPTYECTVTGVLDNRQPVARTFEVLRFGVQNRDGRHPRVGGQADSQVHVIKAWIPTYLVHSAVSQENGAWQVYNDFLIHDGPDNEFEIFATVAASKLWGDEALVALMT